MLLPALIAALFLVQDSKPIPPTPFDRVVPLEIPYDDTFAVDGPGPGIDAEYEVEFVGTLHLWTQSEFDLFFRVADAVKGPTVASDRNSGGGTTPYVELLVEPGDRLAITIACASESTALLTLHLIAAPETEATRAAAATVRKAIDQVRRLMGEGDRAGARAFVATVVDEIGGMPELAASELVSDALFDIGLVAYSEVNSFRDSSRAWAWTVAHRERCLPESHPNLVAARSSLAASLSFEGDLAGARAIQEAILESYERSEQEDHPFLLSARLNLAITLHQIGEIAEARVHYESVIAGFKRAQLEEHPNLLIAQGALAALFDQMGDLNGARALHEKTVAGFELSLSAGHPNLLAARANLAATMAKLGDQAGARAVRESVLAGFERTLPADHPNLLTARGNLALSMSDMGDLVGARALQESVLSARERILPEGHPDLLITRGNLASLMFEMGDYVESRTLYESVLVSLERTLPEDHPGLLSTRLDLASLLRKMGDLHGARTLQEIVLAQFERSVSEEHPGLLTAKANLAGSMHAMGELAGARALRESVLEVYERTRPKDAAGLLDARLNLAGTLYDMGDLAGSRAQLPKLVDGMQSRVLAALALAPRQARQAVSSESYRLSAMLFLSASSTPELKRGAFELTETMRLVASEAARTLAGFESDPELAPILREAALVRRALSNLVAGTTRGATNNGFGASAISKELTALSLRRDQLEREARKHLAVRGVVAQSVDTSALAARLTQADAAVGYRRVIHWQVDETKGSMQLRADHLIAHVLTSKGQLSRVDLGPAAELEALASEWRSALGSPLVRGVAINQAEGDAELIAGRQLRSRIFDPVVAVAGAEVERLFICADDMIFLLPLDALPDAKVEGGRVGDRFRIVNEVSFARLLVPADAVQAAPSLVALGGVDYNAEGASVAAVNAASPPIESGTTGDSGGAVGASAIRSSVPGSFAKLLQTRHEVEATADLFEEAFGSKPVLLTRKESTKAALFAASPGKRYLHVSTHGWFAPDSVRSTEDVGPDRSGFASMGIESRVAGLAPMTLCGLALAGANKGRDSLGRVPGILTAEELCSLDLSQCELAVLSACETNVGIRRAGQGIQSLQAALYAAGARTSITSLWRVDDAATRRLFEVFYTSLWIDKQGKAEALWRAKTSLRDEGYPVRDWAGWVLTGDPD